MVSTKAIEQILRRDGTTFTSLAMPEIRELKHILMPYEQIKFCITGRYEGGFALLCATDLRLLLIDKKFMYLTIEDIRYDMIVEVDYNYRMMDATASVVTPSKTLRFVSTKKQPLRNATTYVQHRIMELRHQGTYQQMQQPTVEQMMAANVEPTPVAAQAYTPTISSGPLVSVHEIERPQTKQFVPRLPMRRIRKAAHPYTQAPLTTRRQVSGLHPSS